MKKYLTFILVLTIMTINTVKGESSTSFVEAWSTNEEIVYNSGNNEIALMFSHKSIAYKDGFIVATANFEKFEKNEGLETTIAIYDKNGNIINSIIIENEVVHELEILNNNIYVVQGTHQTENQKIVKYDEKLNKIAEVESDYNLNFVYMLALYNIKMFTSDNNKLYVVTSEGDSFIEYDENLKKLRTISPSTPEVEEEMCNIYRELCNFMLFDNSIDVNYLGYAAKENYEIHTGILENKFSQIKLIKDNEETIVRNTSNKLIASPRILKNSIVGIDHIDEFPFKLVLLDFEAKPIQTITNGNSIYINLSANEKSNMFMVTTVEQKETCNNGEPCMVMKNTTFKEGRKTIVESNMFSGSADEYFNDIVETETSDYITVGSSNSTDIEGITNKGSKDAIIVKYDGNGKILWQKNYGGSSTDEYTSVVATNDGGVIAIGYSYSKDIEGITNKGDTDAIIIKYDKDGNIVWQHSWGGNSSDYFNDIIKIEDYYIVVGSTRSTDIEGIDFENREASYNYNSLEDGIIVKYDEQGNVIKQMVYENEGDLDFLTIKNTSNGGYVIAGEEKIIDEDNSCDYGISLLIKYDKNDIEEWKYTGTKVDYGSSNFTKIAVLKDDTILAIEHTLDSVGDITSSVLKLTSNGIKESELQSDNELIQEYYNVIATSDGGYILEFRSIYETTQNEEIINDNFLTMVIKFSGQSEEVEWTTFYNFDNYIAQNSILLTRKTIVNKKGELVVVGTFDSQNSDGKRNQDAFFSKLSFDYIIEQEETTNGTYEVTKEDGKGVITLNPEKGYTLDTLTITNVKGEQVEYYEKDGKYYFDLTDAVTVNVTYKEEVINPNTITFLKLGFISIIIFAIYNLFIAKKIKIKQYN